MYEDNEYDGDYPCYTCPQVDNCDVWEAHFCCELCHWYRYEDCDECDPMDI